MALLSPKAKNPQATKPSKRLPASVVEFSSTIRKRKNTAEPYSKKYNLPIIIFMPKKRSKFKLPAWYHYLVFIIIVSSAIGWLSLSFRPVNPSALSETFIIRKGESVDQIGHNLKETNLIRSSITFKLTVFQKNIGTKIQAGSFRLSQAMSVGEIALALTKGRQDIWVTLIEGWRREEIAKALETTFTEVGAKFNKDTFLKATKDKEGRLFPDTYLFPINASEETVISVLETTFEKKITPQMTQAIRNSGRTLDQVLIMASLVEREARDEATRPIIAGILWKRLDNSWPLQVDATLQYAMGYDPIQDTWWKPPTAADKTISSAYNTYQNEGLPPTPICSPSISSLSAAIYPKPSDYWFYLTDTKGIMRYAETVEDHNANITRYLR